MSTAIGLSVLDSSLYIPELRSKKKESALLEMVARAHQAGVAREPALLRETLAVRERIGCTAIGKGVAVPNARSLGIVEPRIVVARSRRGIDWSAPDHLPVSLVLLALSPPEHTEEAHHDLLARAIAVMRLQRNRQRLAVAGSFEEVAAVLREVTA